MVLLLLLAVGLAAVAVPVLWAVREVRRDGYGRSAPVPGADWGAHGLPSTAYSATLPR